MIPQASKPVLAFFCVLMTFMIVLKSTWYTNLSTIESLSVTVIGLVYVILTAFVRRLAAKLRERERIQVGPKARLVIKVVIYGIIMFLMDPFGEHKPDYMLAAALFFSAFHVHFQTHSFEVYEDLGLSQGLITVAVAALVHLAKRGTMKFCVMLFGAFLQALYDIFVRWDIPPQEGPPPRQREEALNEFVLNVADDWRLGEGRPGARRLVEESLAEERLAEERLAEEMLAEERLAEERLAEERLAEERLAEERLAEERLAEERLAEERLDEEREAARVAEGIRKRNAERIRRTDNWFPDEMDSYEMADDELHTPQWDAEAERQAEERNRQDEEMYNTDGTLKEKFT